MEQLQNGNRLRLRDDCKSDCTQGPWSEKIVQVIEAENQTETNFICRVISDEAGDWKSGDRKDNQAKSSYDLLAE